MGEGLGRKLLGLNWEGLRFRETNRGSQIQTAQSGTFNKAEETKAANQLIPLHNRYVALATPEEERSLKAETSSPNQESATKGFRRSHDLCTVPKDAPPSHKGGKESKPTSQLGQEGGEIEESQIQKVEDNNLLAGSAIILLRSNQRHTSRTHHTDPGASF